MTAGGKVAGFSSRLSRGGERGAEQRFLMPAVSYTRGGAARRLVLRAQLSSFPPPAPFPRGFCPRVSGITAAEQRPLRSLAQAELA